MRSISLLVLSFAAGALSDLVGASSAASDYSIGQAIPVTCLNRSIETGEHITNELGELQYIHFPTCNETGRPLELYFGIEKDINCTLDFIDDSLFHLLEFYIHSDAPLTCRVPHHPHSPLSSSSSPSAAAPAAASDAWTPLVIALTGTLQLSHLHVNTALNVLLHTTSSSTAVDPSTSSSSITPGTLLAATAYSASSSPASTHKLVIGDALPLRLAVRWYPSATLPRGSTGGVWAGLGGHLTFSTLVYCLLSAGASAAVCVAYFRGIELPRRLRGYGKERVGLGTVERGRSYGYGVAQGHAQGAYGGYGGGYGFGGGGVGGPQGKVD